ncbi:MAG: tetratricopeptide repeat protein, partial [Terriglobales bacterium]
AIALNPEFAEAYSLLATAHMWTGDTESAIASMKRALQLSPRNDEYAVQLADHALAAQQWDLADTVLQRLKGSQSPEVVEWARRGLARLEEYRRNPPALPVRRVKPPDDGDWVAPQWKRKGPATTLEDEEADERPVEKPPDLRPIRSLRGKLLGVECPELPAAAVSVASGGRTWKMRIADRDGLILIGAEEFSCAWRDRDVTINYREGGQADGDLVSLEIRQPGIEPQPLR